MKVQFKMEAFKFFCIVLLFAVSAQGRTMSNLKSLLNDLRSEVKELKDVVNDQKEGVNPPPPFNDDENEPPEIEYDQDLDGLELPPEVEYDTKNVEFSKMTEQEINEALGYKGDEMKLTEEQRKRGVQAGRTLWNDGIKGRVHVPYRISSQFSATQKDTIRNAFKAINDQLHGCTGEKIHEATSAPNIIEIKGDNTGCWSYLGKITPWAVQPINLQLRGCVYHGIVQHEMLHALGFGHEQSRYDRDEHVTINFENIISGRENNFRKMGPMVDASTNSPYDYGSVMHYGARAFSSNGQDTIVPKKAGVTIGQRRGISPEDIKELRAVYGCEDPTTTQAPATTQAPTTTKAPATTTQAPATTTQAPATTTQAPTSTENLLCKFAADQDSSISSDGEPLCDESNFYPINMAKLFASGEQDTAGQCFSRYVTSRCHWSRYQNCSVACGDVEGEYKMVSRSNRRWNLLDFLVNRDSACGESQEMESFCISTQYKRSSIHAPYVYINRNNKAPTDQLTGTVAYTFKLHCGESKAPTFRVYTRARPAPTYANAASTDKLTIEKVTMKSGACAA